MGRTGKLRCPAPTFAHVTHDGRRTQCTQRLRLHFVAAKRQHLVATRQGFLHDLATDETGRTQYENSMHFPRSSRLANANLALKKRGLTCQHLEAQHFELRQNVARTRRQLTEIERPPELRHHPKEGVELQLERLLARDRSLEPALFEQHTQHSNNRPTPYGRAHLRPQPTQFFLDVQKRLQILVEEAREFVEQRVDLVPERPLAAQRPLDVPAQLLEAAFEQVQGQLVFAREVFEKRGVGVARLSRNGANARRGDAISHERTERGLEDL